MCKKLIKSEAFNNYSAHSLSGSGRGRRGGRYRIGVIHAVSPLPPGTAGDNFNVAACGVKPTGRSLGWDDINDKINCKKCMKILGMESDDDEEPSIEPGM